MTAKSGTKMLHIASGEIVTIARANGAGWYLVVRPDGRRRSARCLS